MTVAHKNLTGTDLHIIKGADTATVGKVPVANGSGDAPFALLTHTSLQTTGNPFGAQLLHVREEQISGTNSASAATASFNVQVLNTVKTNEISGASLASNTITLPAGTYYIEARTCTYALTSSSGSTMALQGRLRNTTAGTTTLSGSSFKVTVGGVGLTPYVALPSIVKGRFTITGSTTFQLQAYPSSAASSASQGFGGGETEVYAEVLIWKVA